MSSKEYTDEEWKNKMKKNSKKGATITIPNEQLGFKAKVYFDLNSYRTRKNHLNRFKYNYEQGKINFMEKLTFVVDVNEITAEESANFKGIKTTQWNKIKQVIYKCRMLLHCCICLSGELVAPQMTACGHVFCWHCILMHFQKSYKANSCPICNQTFLFKDLKTCRIVHQSTLQNEDNINMSLRVKVKNSKKVYNPETLEEDIEFSHLIILKRNGIQRIFNEQRQEIQQFLKNNLKDLQISDWLVKVLSLSEQKIKDLSKMTKNKLKLDDNQRILKDRICHTISINSKNTVYFYQQHEGRFIYLHPICQNILKNESISQKLLSSIQSKIIFRQSIQYNLQKARIYQNINHLSENQQIDLVFIDLKNFVDKKMLEKYQHELKYYMIKQKEKNERQQIQAERRNLKYLSELQYIQKLQNMQQSQFSDIFAPVTMDMSQINNQSLFPSLISQNSAQSNIKEKKNYQQSINKQKENLKKEQKKENIQEVYIVDQNDFPILLDKVNKNYTLLNEKNQFQIQKIQEQKEQKNPATRDIIENNVNFQEEQFPNLEQVPIKSSKNQQKTGLNDRKRNRRRKKDKFVDATKQFFQCQEEM